jgi:hypothetical protein
MRPRADHLDMMQSFTKWPQRRCLPLTRGGSFGEQGFLMKEKSKPTVDPTVYVGNIFMWMMGQPIERTMVYTSFEAIYDDGWRVD